MKKNVSGQKIGGQLITAADGTAFTGSVTVAVTGDAGTQATGSVGSGACVSEGNGYHTYAPAQAETNYDLIAFTFTGTGAIPATVQVYTSFPQTVDNNVLAAGATGFAAIDTVVDAILVDTGTTIPGTISTVDSNVDAILVDTGTTIPATLATIDGIVDTILVDTAEIGTAGAGLTGIAAVGDVTNLSNLPDIPLNWITSDGIAADAIGSSELAASAATEIRTGLATSAELAVVDGIVDTILIDTADIQANYATATALATVDTNVDQILVDTGTTIPATIATVDGIVDTILVDTGTTIPATIATVDGNVDTLITQSATQVKGIIEGLAATGTLSTTQMTTNLSGYADDQLIGRTITWHTSGACDGEQAQIDDSANSGGLLSFTASALTTAPGNNDPFKIT